MTFIKKYRKEILAVILIAINIIIFNAFIRNGGYDLTGKYVPYNSEQYIEGSITAFFIIVPLICIFIGSIFALIPYKDLSYKVKHRNISLYIIFGVNCIMLLRCLIIITLRNV
jgi:hypothetical protein